MAQTVKLKRSAVAAKVPLTSDLALGELAVNTNDGVLYTLMNDGTNKVVQLGGQAVSATVTAGTNAQGQGALTSNINIVTTTAANPSGVTLPTALQGESVYVYNRGTNPINVYPATGAQIDVLGTNVSIQIAVGGWLHFNAASSTRWWSSASVTRTLWGQNFNGSANVTGSLTSVGNITGTGGVTLTSTAAALNLTATGNNPITFNSNGIEIGRFTGDGALGINSSNPFNGTGVAGIEVLASNPTIMVRGTTASSNSTFVTGAFDWYSTPSYAGVITNYYGSSYAGNIIGSLAYANSGNIVFQNTDFGLIYTNGASPLVFGTFFAERARILPGGDIVLGNGDTNATPSSPLLRATNGSGTNIAGGAITIAAGQGTGTGAGGAIIFQTAAAGTAGSGLNALTERMRIAPSGAVSFSSSFGTSGQVLTSAGSTAAPSWSSPVLGTNYGQLLATQYGAAMP